MADARATGCGPHRTGALAPELMYRALIGEAPGQAGLWGAARTVRVVAGAGFGAGAVTTLRPGVVGVAAGRLTVTRCTGCGVGAGCTTTRGVGVATAAARATGAGRGAAAVAVRAG
ncbi:MAG: hypothetical protein AAF214_09845 [Pseudomonadota bacterium]